MVACIEKALIVGGGISGLCLAIGLGDRGVAVDIAEIKEVWTVFGVGLTLQSNVVRAMEQLGILEEYLGAAFPFDEPRVYTQDGELVAKLPSLRLAGPEYPANMGASRLALHNVLSEAAQKRGARIMLNQTVDALVSDDTGVDVTFADGSRGRYDIVVGADGVHSKVRELLFGNAYTPRATGQSVWRHNFPRAKEIDHLAAFPSAAGNAGLLPLSDELMYMFLTSAEPPATRIPKEKLPEVMRERLKGYGGIIGRLRDTIHDPDQIVYRPMEVVFVAEPWFRGRVILIGDAAHTTTPHMAQGAGLAIEDALVLAQELESKHDVKSAFEGFHKRRYERCRTLCEASIRVGEWELTHAFQLDPLAELTKMITLAAEPL